jgi:hypothetical protein
MKKLLIVFVSLLLILSCSNRENSKSKKTRSIVVDKIHIGMTIQEVKDLYKDSEFIEEPLYEYGIDSEDKGLTVIENGEKLFFVWTMQDEVKIHGISIISRRIQIDNGIHVGMKLEDFLKKHPNENLRMDELTNEYEYIYVPDPGYSVEFLTTDTTRAAIYTEPDLEYISIRRTNATIDRISL